MLMRRRNRGQTIIVALIILGLLLIIGFVFIGIIDRNIVTSGRLQTRSVATDLSDAGIRYAQAQLVESELGADWRGTPSQIVPVVAGGDTTLDPDIYYTRPASGYAVRAGGTQVDLGGPDGLGPFVRVSFNGGRSLVRVRYAPSDINIFSPTPTGALRSPGFLRNYLIIESVGRPGTYNAFDPTSLSSTTPVQFQGFANQADFDYAISHMAGGERSFAQRAINRAFASIGIIETARYITNKYNVTRPIDLGVSSLLGAKYGGVDVANGGGTLVPLTQEYGTSLPLYTISNNPTLTATSYPGMGSIYANGDVLFHGHLAMNMNRELGDKIVASTFTGADNNAQVVFNQTDRVGTAWVASTNILTGPALNSRSASFSTGNGLMIDSIYGLDVNSQPRGAGQKIPPSIRLKDSNSGENRYLSLTKESGFQNVGINLGNLGYGQGVYVNNGADRQIPENEVGRQNVGSELSLTYDWLNPNNGQPNSGWKGFYYTPPASYVQFLGDGFLVIRNSAGKPEERTWKNVDGTDTGNSTIRYRLGRGTDGRMHIVNSFTPGVLINGNSVNYDLGPVFNGIMYFDGNVRVRGTIPTDTQITLVSNATIYIEGSITKGVLGNGWTASYNPAVRPTDPVATNVGERLTRQSQSMLMIMATDYVALNTSQFVGPSATQPLEAVNDAPNAPGFTPIRVRTGGQLELQSEFALNNELDPNVPSINPANPSTWTPYAASYYQFNQPGSKIPTSLLLAHTMDDGPAPAAFEGMNINFGAFDTTSPPESTYYFPVSSINLLSTLLTPPLPATYSLYGLGGEAFQRYGKFESNLFSVVDPTTVNVTDARIMVSNNVNGTFRLFSEGTNNFLIRPGNFGSTPTNDYLVGKTALIPHDIRIEASMFAEEGSFFVIPGQWMNPNPNDSRETYDATTGSVAIKNQRRLEDFGSTPGMPFYGEPADIRVSIQGAISENMPPSIDVQSEWMRKWGWIPRQIGASGVTIPDQHVPRENAYRAGGSAWQWVPNLTFSYDPVLATARRAGFSNDPATNPLIRVDSSGRALPPLPRLPVSPALAYFGEVR